MAEKRTKEEGEEAITFSDIDYILKVNQKAIQIYVEVAKQYEGMSETLSNVHDNVNALTEKIEKENTAEIKIISSEIAKLDENNEKIIELLEETKKVYESVEKNLFRLNIALAALGMTSVGAIVTAIIQVIKH